jgi:hypothetical protein
LVDAPTPAIFYFTLICDTALITAEETGQSEEPAAQKPICHQSQWNILLPPYFSFGRMQLALLKNKTAAGQGL